MVRNIFYDTKRSRTYLWTQVDGVDGYEVDNWVPYVYEPVENGPTKTIDGVPVDKVTFGTYQDYNNYQKEHVSEIYENEAPKEIQYLAEKYHHVPDDSIQTPNLKIYSIDIEVHASGYLKSEQIIRVRKKR